jgi:hypothetical protein
VGAAVLDKGKNSGLYPKDGTHKDSKGNLAKFWNTFFCITTKHLFLVIQNTELHENLFTLSKIQVSLTQGFEHKYIQNIKPIPNTIFY